MFRVSVQSKRADEKKTAFPADISEILGSSRSPNLSDITDMTGAPDRYRIWRDSYTEVDMAVRMHAIRLALGVAGLISALSPAVAQQVEQYSGTRRVDKPAAKAAAPRV